MSAYIVDAITIHRIIRMILDYTQGEPGRAERLSKAIILEQPDAGKPLGQFFRDSIGQALWDMNQDAVNARYGESEAAPTYHNEHCGALSRIQRIKTLDCYLYQCDEGNVPDYPLYRFLDAMRTCFMSSYIMALPEYDAALWE